eukprot:CAMPEP_0117422922 /NCGR_PEP_ID=MMETSP0758-20121206/3681_1 /TAXON_ID=63605 /ORGANISM="Percolomonas cosmopolitus, Strain AE-1 (ATCC 50343)" /LENGTH=340 /DNA_ID=CAMNT_0005205865 /DNA_START=15 /DNA_END=1038 /DNA_ORIENTATION=+
MSGEVGMSPDTPKSFKDETFMLEVEENTNKDQVVEKKGFIRRNGVKIAKGTCVIITIGMMLFITLILGYTLGWTTMEPVKTRLEQSLSVKPGEKAILYSTKDPLLKNPENTVFESTDLGVRKEVIYPTILARGGVVEPEEEDMARGYRTVINDKYIMDVEFVTDLPLGAAMKDGDSLIHEKVRITVVDMTEPSMKLVVVPLSKGIEVSDEDEEERALEDEEAEGGDSEENESFYIEYGDVKGIVNSQVDSLLSSANNQTAMEFMQVFLDAYGPLAEKLGEIPIDQDRHDEAFDEEEEEGGKRITHRSMLANTPMEIETAKTSNGLIGFSFDDHVGWLVVS